MASPEAFPIQRILVVGISAAGKSTAAQRIAEASGLPRIELDVLRFDKSWRPTEDDVFHEKLRDLAAEPRWVADGNFMRFTRDTLWPAADLVVWMDPPVHTCLRQALSRTMRRKVGSEASPHGAEEKLVHLIHPDHPVRLLLKGSGARRGRINGAAQAQALSGGCVVRVTSRGELNQLLSGFPVPEGNR